MKMISGYGYKVGEYVIFSDLHLGIEYVLASEGVQIPPFQLPEIEEKIFSQKPRRVIINGDLKHEFSRMNPLERRDVKRLIEELLEKTKEVVVIRGNHDNFVYYSLREWGIELQEYVVIEDTLILHGHKVPEGVRFSDFSEVVIGHEHPTLLVYDSSGAKNKFPVHIRVRHPEGPTVHVLPALSSLALGTAVNNTPVEEFLSPILREIGSLDRAKIYALVGDKVEEMGYLGYYKLFRGDLFGKVDFRGGGYMILTLLPILKGW